MFDTTHTSGCTCRKYIIRCMLFYDLYVVQIVSVFPGKVFKFVNIRNLQKLTQSLKAIVLFMWVVCKIPVILVHYIPTHTKCINTGK